jgi:hypothetical protein
VRQYIAHGPARKAIPAVWQGRPVLPDAVHGEEAVCLPGAGSDSGGDVGEAVEPQPPDGGLSQGGQIRRGVSGATAAGNFVENHVADVVRAVFDAPVPSLQMKKLRCLGLLRRDAYDGEFDLSVKPAVASNDTHHPEYSPRACLHPADR